MPSMPKCFIRAPMAVLFTITALSGCRTPSSKLPLDELRDEEQEVRNQGEAREVLEPLPVEAPSDLFPSEVAALAEAMDPAVVLGLLTPLDKFSEFQQVRAMVSSQIGADLLDPTQWQKVGLDSHGPAGIGLLDIEAEGFFMYASLSDQAAFEGFILRFADLIHKREDLASADVGRGRVYRIGEQISVILREGIAVMVVVDDPDQAPRDYAATVATIDPREALSHDQNFVWARQQLEDADDGMIFVSPNGLIEQIERDEQSSNNNYGISYAEDELAQARADGQSAEYIRELEHRLEEERRWQREREAARAGRRDVVRALFGPIGAFVGAADLRDGAIEAHGRVLIPGEGLLREVFVPAESESPLLSALDEPVLIALDGRADMQALLKLAELLARAEGESLQSFNNAAQAELGIDVLGGLIPALTGAGGVMLTQHREPDPKRLSRVIKSMGLAAYVELSNADAIRQMLDGFARAKRMGGLLTQAKRGDGWLLRVPEWRELHLSLIGDRLIVSTDTKLAARIKDARPGSQAEVLADPDHPLRGPAPTPSLRFYQRWSSVVLLDAEEPWKQDSESMLYDINSHGQLNPDEAAKVPRSRAFKRKLAELDKIVDELNDVQRRRAIESFERELEFAEELGDAGFQVERLTDGLGMHALWRMAPGTTPFEVFFKLYGASRGGSDWSEYERVMERSYTVREELRQIRQADLDAAAAKRNK